MAVKKQWYDIVAPKLFGERVIGETLSSDPKTLIGRKVEVSLLDIAKDFQKFYIKLLFQIERVEGSKAYTVFVGHDCLRERIYRMVQRRSRRVDVIQDVRTKDGVQLRVKTVFVIIRRVNTSIKGACRTKARELINDTISNATVDEYVQMLIAGELQANIRKACNKISPIGNVEIRKSEITLERKKEQPVEVAAE
ncbi:MAG: 30S ribosomal protein S3ae [Candidatus Aenigmarchaeota archaeon]|nr:30S ribosomal protein S3ae [Candidatus Aenigmarchaeota archaeon]